MVERELLFYISFMIWKITQEHYVPPPNHCIMAMMCNHSGIPLCGFEKNKNCYRMFLDDCDLYEYNCDNKADFFTSEINDCTQTSDNHNLCNSKQKMNGTILTTTSTTITTNATTIKMTTSAEATTVKNTTVVPFSLSTVSNITTCTKENNLTTEMVIEKNNTETLDVTTVYPNVTNKEKNNVDKNITVASEITKKNDSSAKPLKNTTMNLNNVTKEKSNVNKNITVPSKTYLVTSTTFPTSTKSKLSNTTTTGNETDSTSNENLNNTTIKHKILSTDIVSTTTVKLNTSSVTKEETTKPMTKQTTDKVAVKPENCDFPSYCDRPKTWLTTSKGETRDFYRIIKYNEGK